ncbi:ATP-binding protein [Parvularcula dongshanensis]|uniref:histidine kinase n=1 Tax=Parvularcula dongshanensis TaxID=1173995 RepID=A0A840I2X6_9PROT|nr:signal transduction histidine kinase/CheY-like chemotaxis protein [Parvularcula dongshanensis]
MRLLKERRIRSEVHRDLPSLVGALREEAAFVVLTEETVRSSDLRPLSAWVEAQPSWSGLAFIILTRRGGGPERNPAATRLQELLVNVSFVERPFHPTTFISVAMTAKRSRERQYEARARLADLAQSEARLRRLTDTLEEQVERRTEELSAANDRLLKEAQQRQEAERKLLQAQKMEALGQLTGGVAHDFNNLLMAILANVEMLEKQLADHPPLMTLLASAREGAERGAALTRRMLTFARQQELVAEPIDPADLLEGMRTLLERSIPPEIELKTTVGEGLREILADRNQLELALLNLVVNARDAMPDGGTISIDVAGSNPEAETGLDAGSYLRVRVSDTGEGMDEATLARATEPFFSTKEVGKGTGLGLAMIHGLAEQMGGALRLSSVLGEGTRAELWLPFAEERVVADEPRATPHQGEEPARTSHEKYRILVVDDDALIQMNTVMMARGLGHDVISASSGSEALSLIEKDDAIDLVLTDHAMPKMTGAELAMRIASLRPDIPIVLATGYAELPGGECQSLPRLSKPYSQSDMAAMIASVMS